MTQLLWATAAAVAVYSALKGYAAWHTALDASGVVIAALVCSRPGVGERMRSLACSFGLLTAAAVGVHVSGGLTEGFQDAFLAGAVIALVGAVLAAVLISSRDSREMAEAARRGDPAPVPA